MSFSGGEKVIISLYILSGRGVALGRKDVSLEKLWNTWDVRCINGIVFLPLGFEIRVGTYHPQTREYIAEYRREGVRLGTHSPDCSVAVVNLEHRGNCVRLSFGKPDPYTIIGEIKTLRIKGDFHIIIEALNLWSNKGVLEFRPSERRLTAIYPNIDRVISLIINKEPPYWGIYAEEGHVRVDLEKQGHLAPTAKRGPVVAFQFPMRSGDKLYFVASVAETLDILNKKCIKVLNKASDLLNKLAEMYEERRVKVVGGEFNGCAQAVIDAIAWNTVWDDVNSRMYTPVSRVWAYDGWKGYVLFEWDTFFNALLASIEDWEIAEANIKAILSEITPRGVIPNYACSPNAPISRTGASSDRAQPPVGAYLTWKVYLRCRDLSLLRWAYPRLKKFHEWWFKARDGNGDGLLEWGSDPIGTDKFRHTLQAAKFESGLDNSPMYDEAEFVEEKNTMNLIDVGLNSLYALDALSLAKIAQELNLKEDAEKFLREYEEIKERINKVLWCEEEGLYLNRFWDGRFSKRKSPTCFYPLVAGIPDKHRAERMVKEHLLNSSEFWGEFVIPSISKDDPAFKDNNYWRGRIWGPMNFLVYEGLKRYGFDEVAYEFALKSVKLFMKEWLEETHYHENYNAETGEGDDVPNSDPFYSWGALLAILGVQELFDVEDGGLRFGSLSVREVNELSNYRVGCTSYSVKVGPNVTEAMRDGRTFFRANRAVIVRNYKKLPDYVEFDIKGEGIVEVTLFEFSPKTLVETSINDRRERMTVNEDGSLTLKLELKRTETLHIVIKRIP